MTDNGELNLDDLDFVSGRGPAETAQGLLNATGKLVVAGLVGLGVIGQPSAPLEFPSSGGHVVPL